MVRVHQAEIYRYLRFLGAVERDLAEDLVQETFVAAWESRQPPDATDPERRAAWLRGIARNRFRMHCRRARASPVVYDEATLERAERVWTTEYLRGDDGSDYREALRRCVERLDPGARRAIELRYRDELGRAEMAGRLGLSEDGVKSLLRRIRAGLADCVRRTLAGGGR